MIDRKGVQARLIAKARQGVRVHFLHDEIGCRTLAKRYLREFRAALRCNSPSCAELTYA